MTSQAQTQSANRILVVDNEQSIGYLLLEWLSREKHHVCCVLNGEEARSRMREESFDLVIIDAVMPASGGVETLPWIRQQYPQIGVLIAAVANSAPQVIQTMRLGAIGYLLKPFDMYQVSEEIRRAIQQQYLKAEKRRQQQALEEELQTARETAETIGRFLNGYMRHINREARTSLNGIVGFFDLLLETELSACQRDYLLNIQTASRELTESLCTIPHSCETDWSIVQSRIATPQI